MRVLLTTNEYPPYVYGGAGVHVEYLSRELAKLTPVEVRSFHDQTIDEGQLRVRGIKMDTTHFAGCPQSFVSPLKALSTCLSFVGQGISDLDGNAEIIHCHTWYAHFSGILAKILYNIPMVITVHSLEPLRPWKRDQLGHGYDLSRWIEKTALETADTIIAVSRSTRDDILRLFDVEPTRVVVIPNGIDTEEYRPTDDPDTIHVWGAPQGFRGGIDVDGRGDHRVIMLLSIVALRCQLGLRIHGAEHVSKSFPGWFDTLRSMGVRVEES